MAVEPALSFTKTANSWDFKESDETCLKAKGRILHLKEVHPEDSHRLSTGLADLERTVLESICQYLDSGTIGK